MKKLKIEKKNDKLSLCQKEFCNLYISNDTELYGNGALCYLEAYGAEYFAKYKKQMLYNVAASSAYQLLKKPSIYNYINSLLQIGGFNNENVDKQHLFLLNQHSDLKTKLGAIKEYNTLKKRIDNNQIVVVVDPDKKNSFSKALEYLKK